MFSTTSVDIRKSYQYRGEARVQVSKNTVESREELKLGKGG
jgi:hypothetical protein